MCLELLYRIMCGSYIPYRIRVRFLDIRTMISLMIPVTIHKHIYLNRSVLSIPFLRHDIEISWRKHMHQVETDFTLHRILTYIIIILPILISNNCINMTLRSNIVSYRALLLSIKT